MDERTCMITGANSGIGKETALQLAKMGTRVVMVCRNEERGRKAQKEIKEESGNAGIELLLADLGSLTSVRRLVDEFKKNHVKLHVLINNAGTFNWERKLSEDGYESTFAVNYLAHFLLSNLLLLTLKKSAPSRIINVSSDIHKYLGIDFDDLMSEKQYKSQKAYSNSKTAMVLFTYELARRLKGTGVTVNALHPGHTKTNMYTNRNWLFNRIMSIIPVYASVENAAKTPVYLASSPEVEGVTGKYFRKCKTVKSKMMTYDEANQRRLWEISEELVGLR